MAEKRYFWLKLKSDFFSQRQIKALRRLDNGADLIVVYLKLLLLCLNTNGLFHYQKLLPDCIEELALAIDEDVSISNSAVETFIRFGLVERLDNADLQVLTMSELIGSEGSSAERMRRSRASQCDVTPSQCDRVGAQSDVERENREHIEADVREKSKEEENAAFSPPSLAELSSFISANRYNVSASKFHSYYQARNWLINGEPFDWKVKVAEWSGTEYRNNVAEPPRSEPSYERKAIEKHTMQKYANFFNNG